MAAAISLGSAALGFARSVPDPRPQTQINDGRTSAHRADEDIGWINDGITRGLSVHNKHPAVLRGELDRRVTVANPKLMVSDTTVNLGG